MTVDYTDPAVLLPDLQDRMAMGEFLRTVAQLEQDYKKIELDLPAGCFGWLPFPLALFITYMADAVQEAPGNKFLDVGGGPGTKLMVAEYMFGQNVAEVELDHTFAELARGRGYRVAETDARTWTGYGRADIVYHNRPVNPQEPFEEHVMEHMRAGAVLIAVHAKIRPSERGWIPVAEEWADPRAPVNGVWQKP